MMRLVLFDLGVALLGDGRPLPGVVDALRAIADFTNDAGDPLVLGLVADFGALASSESVLREAEGAFAALLRSAQIDQFFEPFEEKVTISARAGARMPDRRLFETAIRRSRVDATFSESLFIANDRSHLAAAQSIGLRVLGSGADAVGAWSFSSWLQAPQIVAEIVAPRSDRNRERAFSLALKQAHGVVGFKCLSRDDTTFHGQGMRLLQLQRPDLGDLTGVFVEFPVDVAIRCDARGAIEAVETSAITEEDVGEAIAHVRRLARRGQISADPRQPAPGATHAISTDDAGHRIIVRQRFAG